MKKNVRGFSETALDALIEYPWPGNVRQLRSTIRRATLLADEMIAEKELDLRAAPASEVELTPGPAAKGIPWQGLSLQEIVERNVIAVEREVLTQVLKHTGGNKAKAARLLQIDYKTIHTKLKKLRIWEGRFANRDHGADSEPEPSASQPPVSRVDELGTQRQGRETLAA